MIKTHPVCCNDFTEDDVEDPDIVEKRKVIEKYLQEPEVDVEIWKNLAKTKGGLIDG